MNAREIGKNTGEKKKHGGLQNNRTGRDDEPLGYKGNHSKRARGK